MAEVWTDQFETSIYINSINEWDFLEDAFAGATTNPKVTVDP